MRIEKLGKTLWSIGGMRFPIDAAPIVFATAVQVTLMTYAGIRMATSNWDVSWTNRREHQPFEKIGKNDNPKDNWLSSYWKSDHVNHPPQLFPGINRIMSDP
ncbi:Complex IV (CIV) cytochrome c:O2 oxidoreductase subunit CoxAF4 [Andalucia godoyi]|uniref:Complex IV (CIV) cytochrome c:O2 oxidoreductase subunit CoxAF4 n=1 Tax=Andalucia godoyi TaxID=505711 RepID=A0A8K0AHS7_ANDGO|nr:Complex IV (CIV) cytochrome c:O2 oxidoreductase subunit CoxAF4 [Andalucia godoyi]|eukprot:ANDGO_04015.mRNA.1 mitochondrial Complex I (CI) NADH:ubiquinone oxidoreductase subunit MLRQ/ NUML/NDUFA4